MNENYEKTAYVTSIFHRVAAHYDSMNDVMSLGMHRLWKRFFAHISCIRPGQCVLDLAGGTGDVTRLLAKRVGAKGTVVLADINARMLDAGRDRLLNAGYATVKYVQADATALPFRQQQFDAVTIAFGLRNFADKQASLSHIRQVLRPGGSLWILEFSKPVLPMAKALYPFYLSKVIPALGELVAKDRASYQYLADSIKDHPSQAVLLDMMKTAGFERCQCHNLLGGIVAIHRGYRL